MGQNWMSWSSSCIQRMKGLVTNGYGGASQFLFCFLLGVDGIDRSITSELPLEICRSGQVMIVQLKLSPVPCSHVEYPEQKFCSR